MNPEETAVIERYFPLESDQSIAIWYVRSAKAAIAAGHRATKDRIWDQYCHSAVVHGVKEALAPHKTERFLPLLRELKLLDEGSTVCGNCDWFRRCRSQSCFVTPDQEKCQFPRDDGTSAWKRKKLRGSERRRGGGEDARG